MGSESQEFLAFAAAKPRMVAKPLLRLVESGRREKISDPKLKAPGAVNSVHIKNTGKFALQALVNLSALPAVATELITELNAPRRICEALHEDWLQGHTEYILWFSMVLANLSTTPQGQEALSQDVGHFRFMLNCFLSKHRPPSHEEHEDPIGYLGKVIGNCCADVLGRRQLSEDAYGLSMLGPQLQRRESRIGVLNIFRNLALDVEFHSTLAKTSFLQEVSLFLYPWNKVKEEDRLKLPKSLRESLEAGGAAITSDTASRNVAADCFGGLSLSSEGCKYLSDGGGSEILHSWMAEEEVTETHSMLVQTIARLSMFEQKTTAQKITDSVWAAEDGEHEEKGAPSNS